MGICGDLSRVGIYSLRGEKFGVGTKYVIQWTLQFECHCWLLPSIYLKKCPT
jgi:hypothetical protein